MFKFLVFFLVFLTSLANADLTLNSEGSRGILSLYSAKSMGAGRMALAFSPAFVIQDIGIENYTGDISDLEWSLFPQSRNIGSVGIGMPITFGWGWTDWATTSLGLKYYYDKIDAPGTAFEGISESGFSEFNILQKFSIPTANPAFNIAFIAHWFFNTFDNDGLILTDPRYHAKSTHGVPADKYEFQTYTANKSDKWAFKSVVPLTVDISAINPEIMLEFHLNVGATILNRESPNDNNFFGAVGFEFSPHHSFGIFSFLTGGYKYQNFMNNADIFKDLMTLDFGFNVKSSHVSFTTGAQYAISESPTSRAYYEIDSDDPNNSSNQKALNSNTNASLYYRESDGDTWLINAPVPPKWKIGTQLAFHWFIWHQDTDGDGIPDKYDLCPTTPGLPEFQGCPNPDRDGDGVCDPWVEEKGLSNVFSNICKGVDLCPDLDGRGSPDGCPNPDSDGDGVCDPWVSEQGMSNKYANICTGVDLCPNEHGQGSPDGCPVPDRDGDGICDPWVSEQGLSDQYAHICTGIDYCPDTPGVAEYMGCPGPDTDGDGICDPWVSEQGLLEKFADICSGVDLCPEDSGSAEFKGCPNPDTDGDGVCDPWVAQKGLSNEFAYICTGTDFCPDTAGTPGFFGCPNPDPDGDGVCHAWVSERGLSQRFASICQGVDKCPGEHGQGSEDGCPPEEEVKAPEPVIIREAPKAVELPETPIRLEVFFETGSARLTDRSMPALRDLIRIMTDDPDARIMIEGHTDSQGGYDYNINLSLRRANSVRTYLVKNGIHHSRIETKGWGPDQPIADNETPEGRQLNRRIEIRRIK